MTRSRDADRILSEWFDAYERGEARSPEELLRAHPELAEELRDGLAALGVLEFDEGAGRSASPPETIGDYRIVREIGRGGMGVVYEAEQVSMGRAWR